mmetsp:Transcript_18684/g.52258  ORF Transcript_18684/g.52258 Transcript_18684/m.52258 type:complete len:555 (-) Transcript_18684:4275-5939(-)
MALSRWQSTLFAALLLARATIVASWSSSARCARDSAFHTNRFHRHDTETSGTSLHRLLVAPNGMPARQRLPQKTYCGRSLPTALLSASTASAGEDTTTAVLAVEAYSGLSDEEFAVLVRAVEEAYSETVGLAGVSCDISAARSNSNDKSNIDRQSDRLVGTLHRVLSVKTNLDEEIAECLRALIAEQMDHLIYGSGELGQPVLVSVRTASDAVTENEYGVQSIVENEIDQYGLRIPVHGGSDSNENAKSNDSSEGSTYAPTLHIAIDGAETQLDGTGETFWDTSTVLVFDDMVTDDLRARLLEVVKGKKSADDNWNDNEQGPDPSRWVRGGLQDVPGEEDGETKDQNGEETTTSCWGLPGEVIEEICFREHDAIQEFESILTNLFPRFLVSRLPEAVYGECVSPLTANAPVASEDGLYDYHIDGDPLQTPPSPWTDIYGRYPNRSPGKPRFVSCLVYLNEEWDGANWGAPTRFYDPPTGESYEVTPAPGRCVIMDQDVGHTVVPPRAAAGKRPRYSLVWKLVLHPRTENQDMTDLLPHSRAEWPEPVLFGSAVR